MVHTWQIPYVSKHAFFFFFSTSRGVRCIHFLGASVDLFKFLKKTVLFLEKKLESFFLPLRRVYLEKNELCSLQFFRSDRRENMCKNLYRWTPPLTRPQHNKFGSEKDGFIIVVFLPWFYLIALHFKHIWPLQTFLPFGITNKNPP